MDELRELLLRAEAGRVRPRVTLPDLDGLRRAAHARTVRRAAITVLTLVAVGLGATQWSSFANDALQPPRRELIDLGVLRAAESAAAMRYYVALRTADPRSELESLVARFPETTSAQRAVMLLDNLEKNR